MHTANPAAGCCARQQPQPQPQNHGVGAPRVIQRHYELCAVLLTVRTTVTIIPRTVQKAIAVRQQRTRQRALITMVAIVTEDANSGKNKQNPDTSHKKEHRQEVEYNEKQNKTKSHSPRRRFHS